MRDNIAHEVTPESPEAWEERNLVMLARLEQERSPSASMQRVDANGVVA